MLDMRLSLVLISDCRYECIINHSVLPPVMISAGENFCSVYEGASVLNLVVSILITVGIFVSYLPQYFRIHHKRTSEGLSVNFLLLGSCSLLFTLTNIVLISSRARYCCRIGALTMFNCINSQLNLIQIGLQCICAIMILVLVLLLTKGSVAQDKEEYAKITRVGRFVVFHAALSLLQIVVGLSAGRPVLLAIAQFNGVMSTILTVIKYVPQIHTTYHLKHPGTLSIGMMCIQTPGGFIFTATLFFTKGSHWSSWMSYFTAATLQGTLLALCIYYEYFSGYRNSERETVARIVDENLHEESADEDDTARLIGSV